MAAKRVTMQDIADACGLSRFTVSKVFNGHGSVPEATRRAVIAKAEELGYGKPAQGEKQAEQAEEPVRQRSVALLTQHKLLTHNFGAYFLTSFTDQLSRKGYSLKFFEVSQDEIAAKALPPHFERESVSGILCIELFNRDYQNMIAELGIPSVFVDGYAGVSRTIMNCDCVMMENSACIIALMNKLFSAGSERIGFVGDKDHCDSFFQRWAGYFTALNENGIAFDPGVCILDRDSDDYGSVDFYLDKLRAMPRLPDAFVCANDYIAIHLMSAVKQLGLRIPEDVMITGFDGSPEASLVDPSLTTVSIQSSEIGNLSADVLNSRILQPDRPYRRVFVLSTPVFAESTERK